MGEEKSLAGLSEPQTQTLEADEAEEELPKEGRLYAKAFANEDRETFDDRVGAVETAVVPAAGGVTVLDALRLALRLNRGETGPADDHNGDGRIDLLDAELLARVAVRLHEG